MHDANAAPMFDAFSNVADLTPYERIPRNVPYEFNPPDNPFAAESARMNFSEPDQAKGLSRMLWRMYRGTEPPWPRMPAWPENEEDEEDDDQRKD